VLTHYLMTKDWRDKIERLTQFVALLGQGKSPEDAAKSSIGDPKALEERFSSTSESSPSLWRASPRPPR